MLDTTSEYLITPRITILLHDRNNKNYFSALFRMGGSFQKSL